MKVLMTGNPTKDLCGELVKIFETNGHECLCLSRANGYDFQEDASDVISRIKKLSENYDLFINLYANYFFNASILAHKIFNHWFENGWKEKQIINMGSTTDRVQRGKCKLYHYEKRILREMSSGHSLLSVWEGAPRVTHLSIGTMENRSHDNPGRKCLSLAQAAGYVYWITQQPRELHINELSIDPVQ